jgi:hypothetical protein
LAETGPGSIAKTPPNRRKRPLLLYLMVATSLSAVAGTVLLSNDMKHLRALLKAADLNWIADRPPPPVAERPPARPAPPAAPTVTAINPRLFRMPEPDVASALRRTWQMTGPDMCRSLERAGIAMSPWKAAAIGGDIHECSYEKIYARDGERITSSLFVMVRGDAKGRITSMRAKLVDPPRQPGGNLDPALLAIFETMLTQSRWGDFGPQLDAIRTLNDIKKEDFGAALSFTREFDKERNYNFLLTLKATTPEQRRLNDLFRSENGFDLQQEPGVEGLFPGMAGTPGTPGAPGLPGLFGGGGEGLPPGTIIGTIGDPGTPPRPPRDAPPPSDGPLPEAIPSSPAAEPLENDARPAREERRRNRDPQPSGPRR